MIGFIDYEDEPYPARWARWATQEWRDSMKPICHGSGGYATGHYRGPEVIKVEQVYDDSILVRAMVLGLIIGFSGATLLWWL